MNSWKLACVSLVICSTCIGAGKLSAQVRTAWFDEFNSPASDEDIGIGVELDSEHNVVVAGWSEGVGTGRDALLLKYNRTGKLLWSSYYNGTGNSDDSGSSPVIDSNDNIFLSVSADGGSAGWDFLVLKYDPNGTLLWDKRFNGTGNGTDYTGLYGALEVDPAGNAYVVGYSWSAAGHYELVTIKYRPDGTEDWLTRYTGPHATKRNTYGWALAFAPSGSLYVAGNTANISGDSDYLLLKLDPATGAIIWDKLYDGAYNLDEGLYDIVLDQSENIYLVGYSETSGGFEYCAMKCDSSGLFQWEGRWGGTKGYHYAWVIDVDSLGNSYVTGASMTTGGQYDIVTVKYDAQGTREWAQRYRDSGVFGEDWGNHVEVGPDGNIYVTGRIWRYFNDGFDAVTLKYDPAGTLLWDEVYGGSVGGDDTGFEVAIDDDNNVFVAGTARGFGTGSDALLIKYSQSPAPSLTVTPDPLQPGQHGSVQAIDLEPLTLTFLAYSVVGSNPVFIPPINVTLNLTQPKQAGPAMTTDGVGSVGWGSTVHPALSGINIWFQVAQYNQVTNVVATFVL
jgi:uncharacterized delta-60 repeat protein